MGLDPRDCRLDIAFILCDSSIPDSVSWDESLRDKSGVWLDFIDFQFDPSDYLVYDTCSDLTEIDSIPTGSITNTDIGAEVVLAKPVGDTVCTKPLGDVINATGTNNIISVKPVSSVSSTRNKSNVITVGSKSNTISARKSSTTVSVKPRKDSV